MTLDGEILLWIRNSLSCTVLDRFMIAYTKLGDAGMVWIVLSLLLLLHPKTRKAGALALAAMAAGLICTNLTLKPLVHRVRPWLVVEGLTTLVQEGDPHSFPSGHTCAAFAAAVSWSGLATKRRWKGLILAAAVVMGFSRLYVGVHFPSDVLAGACVGWLCADMVRRVHGRLRHRLPRSLQ